MVDDRNDSLAVSRRTALLAECESLSSPLYAWARLRLRALGTPALSAEDVVQETWARAFAAVESEERGPRENLRGWVFGIAQNVLLEQARSLTPQLLRSARASEGSVSQFLAQCEDTVTSLCTRLARDETVADFFALADGLDSTDRALLVSCGFEGVSASDVGRRLGLSADTAIKRWQRLRESLRQRGSARKLGLIA